MRILDTGLGLALGRLTSNEQERRNVFWRTLAMLLTGAAIALYGGELWAAFLTKSGFSMTQIGALSSVSLLSNALGLLAFMGLADRIRDRIRAYVLCVLVTAVFPPIVSGLALAPGVSRTALFVCLIVLGIVQQLVAAMWIMLDYPVLVRTVSPEIRGRMFAILTTACGVLPIITGVLSAKVLRDVAYPRGYVFCFMAGAAMVVLRAGAFSAQRELPVLAVPGASRSALPFAAIVDVLRMKAFQQLAGPHVLRGLTISIVGFAIPQGLRLGILPTDYPGYATSASWAAGILAGIVLGFIADRWGAGPSTLLGDVLYALGLGMAVVCHNPLLFLVFYFLLQLGQNIEASAVPFGCTIIVPPELMGAFSSARLMVLMGSGAVGSILFGYLFDHANPILLFAIGAALKLLNGIWFWLVFRPKRPVDRYGERS
jgi:MFS family permease